MTGADDHPLSDEALDTLAGVAERSVHLAVRDHRRWVPDPHHYPPELREAGAAFVTLRREHHLRGCIGTMAAVDPLVVTVADRARAAAFDDPRFVAVGLAELDTLEVSVSVLSPMRRVVVASYEELLVDVRVGVDGLLVEAGRHRATLLPSVWDDLADPDSFVAALWRKAGLAPRAWSHELTVSRYTAQHARRT